MGTTTVSDSLKSSPDEIKSWTTGAILLGALSSAASHTDLAATSEWVKISIRPTLPLSVTTHFV